MTVDKIRNFCIIAHIDHGKSTLADRFLEITGTIEKRKMKEQLLDTMDIERERGITIKLQPVRMDYQGYVLNLIDTPGHVDFTYEVSRSLAAVEGAILVVDSTQGIEAQTLANLYLAMEHNLTIIPVVNKIDLPNAEPEKVAEEVMKLLGVSADEIIFASGKTGQNVEQILERVIRDVPPPKNSHDEPRALIFDSIYDAYRGVVAFIRVFDGELKADTQIVMPGTGTVTEIQEVGVFRPEFHAKDKLTEGEIGYVITGLKNVKEVRVGDTMLLKGSHQTPWPGFKTVKPFVFAGLFPVDTSDYHNLREAVEKLQLSDSAFTFEPENSPALGLGFRGGFLGLLHLEIVNERLEREFNLEVIATTPTVSYKIVLHNGEERDVANIADLPDPNHYEKILEPWMEVEVVTPNQYVGNILELLQSRRGIQKNMEHIGQDRLLLKYEAPLSSLVIDFYDKLKSVSSGYASMAYDFIEFREGDLARVDILVAGEKVDALSRVAHRSEAVGLGRAVVAKLKDLIPRQMFKIILQAAIGGAVIAREDISAMRKDVLAKLYGGDRTRKDKLLEKQKKGKKKMKQIGNVDIPKETFLKLLK